MRAPAWNALEAAPAAPDLVFSGVDILNAAIDPISAADFQGTLSFTPGSIAINFANLTPLAGHALVIDVTSVPEPSALLLLGLPIAGLAWARRGRSVVSDCGLIRK